MTLRSCDCKSNARKTTSPPLHRGVGTRGECCAVFIVHLINVKRKKLTSFISRYINYWTSYTVVLRHHHHIYGVRSEFEEISKLSMRSVAVNGNVHKHWRAWSVNWFIINPISSVNARDVNVIDGNRLPGNTNRGRTCVVPSNARWSDMWSWKVKNTIMNKCKFTSVISWML